MGILHAEVFDSGYCKGHGRRADIGVYRIKNQMVLLLMTSLHEIFFSHRINWDIFVKYSCFYEIAQENLVSQVQEPQCWAFEKALVHY